jgi:hypothetical protein
MASSYFVFMAAKPKTQITAANAARIRHGMSSEEVQEIFGGPPRIESSQSSTPSLEDLVDLVVMGRAGNGERVDLGYLQSWASDEFAALVFFKRGKVATVWCVPQKQPDALDRALSWLRSFFH